MPETRNVSSIPALVEPELLLWARKRANLEQKAAARKIGVSEQKVAAWEEGTVLPTIAEMRKASAVYRQTLAVFFLPEPPIGFETLRDFRRLYTEESRDWSAELHSEYQRAHYQRDVVLEVSELEDKYPSTAWRVQLNRTEDAFIASLAREQLQSAAALPEPTSSSDEYQHLNYWTNALEESGVLVMTTEGGRVSKDEMRAFSLYFDIAPVIMLNGADATRGRLFSLIHEYVHLLLHTEGLCDTITDQRATTPDRRLEARCNAIAAEILMPSDLVLASRTVEERDEWDLASLIAAARPFGVSAESFLRRLVTLGKVPLSHYQSFREEQDSIPKSKKKTGGGHFYRTKARDLGKGYVRRVSSAHRRALIDSATAATYLDVKVGQIDRLASVAQV